MIRLITYFDNNFEFAFNTELSNKLISFGEADLSIFCFRRPEKIHYFIFDPNEKINNLKEILAKRLEFMINKANDNKAKVFKNLTLVGIMRNELKFRNFYNPLHKANKRLNQELDLDCDNRVIKIGSKKLTQLRLTLNDYTRYILRKNLKYLAGNLNYEFFSYYDYIKYFQGLRNNLKNIVIEQYNISNNLNTDKKTLIMDYLTNIP